MSETLNPDSTQNFGSAMAQIEEILKNIEMEEVDLDDLVDEVARASELIRLCRSKIERAEVEIERVVTAIDGSGAES